MNKNILFFLLCTLFTIASCTQPKAPASRAFSGPVSGTFAVGFYNLENLYDTIHDKGVQDLDFTPTGKFQWNTEKYQSKLANMSRVLAEIGTDQVPEGAAIIGLAEVENRRVLNDLLKQEPLRKRNFRCLHVDSPDRRGIDCAMLYNPDLFQLEDSLYIYYIYPDAQTGPKPVGFVQGDDNRIHATSLYGDTTFITRGFLVGIGTMAGEKLAVIVCHWPSRGAESEARERAAMQVYQLKEALIRQYPGIKIIIEGDMNDNPNNRSMTKNLKCVTEQADVKRGVHDLYNPWYNTNVKEKRGTLLFKGNWDLFDQIVISGNFINGDDHSTLSFQSHQIFRRDYLIQQSGDFKGNLLRTHAGGEWLKGYSDHLPTCIYLVKSK